MMASREKLLMKKIKKREKIKKELAQKQKKKNTENVEESKFFNWFF